MSTNCFHYGDPDDSKYNEPLLMIGIYVAGASLLCAIFIIIDIYRTFPCRKQRINSQVFSLNAATLTLLGVATKISTDITTPMWELDDQRVKYISILFIFITIVHVMPSLGMMEDMGILFNVIALGILVVTVFANIWIQIHTGVVLEFRGIDMVASLSMLFVFAVFVSYSLAVTTTKRMLEEQFNSKHKEILQVIQRDDHNQVLVTKIKEYLEKYWIMAVTSCPDYVLRSTGTQVVAAVAPVTVLQVTSMLLRPNDPHSEKLPCTAESHYKWSTTLVYWIQCVFILLESVASVVRDWHFGSFVSCTRWRALPRMGIEKHWVQLFVEWKEVSVLGFKSKGYQWTRKAIDMLKNFILNLFLTLQVVIICICKVILLGIISINNIIACGWLIIMRIQKFVVHSHNVVVEDNNIVDLKDYVLWIEGEKENIPVTTMVRYWRKFPQKWIEDGRKDRPLHLLEFIRNLGDQSPLPEGLGSLLGLSNGTLSPTNHEGLPKCWTMTLVTLTIVARVTTLEHHDSTESLWRDVREGLRYVTFIEKSLGNDRSKKMMEVAEMVWKGVDLYDRWLDVDLKPLTSKKWSDALQVLLNAAYAQFQGEITNKKSPAEYSSSSVVPTPEQLNNKGS